MLASGHTKIASVKQLWKKALLLLFFHSVAKIQARERFCAYIVIPMFPEGDPTSAPIQEILYWQTNTMQMMYHRVGGALREAGLDSLYHPTDYLLFLCPGKREQVSEHLELLAEPTEEFAKR